MNPIQVLQYLASAALEKSAFRGGLATAALGAAFYFGIAVPVGLLYGAAVYFFMKSAE